MDKIEIRDVCEADVAAITAIYRPAVITGTASFELEPPGEAEMTDRMKQITRAGFPYLVATRGGRVLGYAYANSYRTRPAYRFTVEDSIYVDVTEQGRGIGRALLDRLVNDSAQLGFRQMVAVIGDSRQIGSIALHRAAGFTFCGTMHSVGYKFDRWIDCVIMQRALGDGDTTAVR